MTTTNCYQDIAARNTIRRARDLAFALVLAAVTAFSLTSITTAARTVSTAPSASPATPAVVAAPQLLGCDLPQSC